MAPGHMILEEAQRHSKKRIRNEVNEWIIQRGATPFLAGARGQHVHTHVQAGGGRETEGQR